MIVRNDLEIKDTLSVGALPTASESNYSVLFENSGLISKRIVGNIINFNTSDFISGISTSFPSIFNYNTSITPSDPNLVVSLKNQLAGTVFAAPETLNGTPSFRKLSDVDLSETTVAFQDDIPTSSDFITTNTNQTGLSGNKTIDAIWTYAGARSYSLSLERTNGPNNSNIRYATTTSNVYAGIGDADYFAIGASSDIRRSLSTTWMWVNSDGLTSRNGFNIEGRTDNDIVLAGGGHRPVSDFALAGSLGDYVPYTGATQDVHLNGKSITAVSSYRAYRGSDLTWANAVNSDPEAWNQDNMSLIQLRANNNALAFIADGTSNARKFGIQVGHSLPAFASATGTLWLQPLHGQTGIGSLSGTGDRMVVADSQGILSTQSLPSDNYLRLGSYTESQGHYLTTADAFSLRNTVVWSNSGANRPNNSNSTIVAFTPYKGSSSAEYGFFLGARNNRLWLSTLENSTPSGWVEIAKRSEFDNYLPLSGGTMTGIVNFTGNYAAPLVLNRTAPNNILNGYSSSTSTIYSGIGDSNVYAIGDTADLRQSANNWRILINSDGRIFSKTDGDSSQWKQAYDWGNHADAGYYQSGNVNIPALGGDYRVFPRASSATNTFDLDTITESGFYYQMTNNNPNSPKNGFWYIENHRYISGSNNNLTQYAHPYRVNDGKWMRHRFQGTWSNWVEFIHSENISTYTPITSISRNGVNIPIVNQNVNIPIFSTSGAGLVPARVGSVATKYLREDGTWVTPTNTTYSAGSVALLTAGTNTTNRVWRADHLKQGILSLTYNPENLSFGIGLNYNATTGVLTSNQDSIFAYSPQGGLYTTDWSSTALGQHSIAIGYTSVVTASSSISIGKGVFTGGAMSQNVGFSSNVNKALSANFGSYNLNNAELGNTFGQGLINQGMGTTVIGKYNQVVNHQPNMDEDIKTPAIQFGVGKDELTRRNAVTIFNDRRMDYDSQRDDSAWHQHTIPDIKWIQENISGGGGGGNMNFAYIDHTNTHAFGTDEANGLLIPASLISGSPAPANIISAIKVYAHDDEGGYSAPTIGTFCNPLAVSVTGDILVRRGCIKLPSGIDVPTMLGTSNKLVLLYDKGSGTVGLQWTKTLDLFDIKHHPDYLGIYIGDAFNDSTGDAYFNVNPQII